MTISISNLATNFWSKNHHAVLFTIVGGYVTGWPLASARYYLAYIFGLMLVWTLPINKLRQSLGWCALAICLLAKTYVGYLTPPILEAQTIPIAMYQGKLISQHSSISEKLTEVLHEHFASNIDLFAKNPKSQPPNASGSINTLEPILYDFNISPKYVDRSKIWALPVEVQQAFTEAPFILAIKITKANHGIIWRNNWQDEIFFEQKADNTLKSHRDDAPGMILKEHVGSTFFFPFIDSPKYKSVYIEFCPSAIYIPLLLLVAAILLVNFTQFSVRTFEQLICLSFAFITICTSDLRASWPNYNLAYASKYSLSNWVHHGIWDNNAGQSPLWYLINKLFYQISYFGYLLPILWYHTAAWALLRLLREFFQPYQVYIIWGILLASPWLAMQGIGLHVYNPWNIAYNSMMLAVPPFLIGLAGYCRNFKPYHGLAWVAASLCNPTISVGISILLLHKHLGRQRFIYLGLSLCLSIIANIHHLISMLALQTDLPTLVSLWKVAYQPFFLILGLIPNLCMSFSKTITLKRFARASLTMHSGFMISAIIPQEAYLACTLSAICSLIYLTSYYEYFIRQYQRITAKS